MVEATVLISEHKLLKSTEILPVFRGLLLQLGYSHKDSKEVCLQEGL